MSDSVAPGPSAEDLLFDREKRIEELESQIHELTKQVETLQAQVDEAKKTAAEYMSRFAQCWDLRNVALGEAEFQRFQRAREVDVLAARINKAEG